MKVTVRFFASLREALGPVEVIELAEGATAGAARDLLIARGGRFAEVLSRGRAVRCAVDQVMADEEAPLGDGTELAFFPPVTGG
jgi:molybdopterin synthase sulfur carrier subunit